MSPGPNNETVKLLTLRTRLANEAGKDAGALPTRLKLLSWGDNPSVHPEAANVRVGERSAADLAGGQKARGFDRVALDFEHNTVPGSPEFERTREPRSVAGYGVPRVVAGEGLFLEEIEWTPTGKLSALDYKDLSPTVKLDENGEVTFVHSVALTRAGAVEGLSFFSVNIKTNENHMSTENKTQSAVADNVIVVADLAPTVGLAATASKADVLGKLVALSSLALSVGGFEDRLKAIEKANANPPGGTPGSTAGGTPAATPELVALTARLEGIEKAFSAQASAASEVEKGRLIRLFAQEGRAPKDAEGKEYSAEGLSKLDVTTLKLLYANTPQTVPIAQRHRMAEGQSKDQNLKGRDRMIAAFDRENAKRN